MKIRFIKLTGYYNNEDIHIRLDKIVSVKPTDISDDEGSQILLEGDSCWLWVQESHKNVIKFIENLCEIEEMGS